MVGPSLAWRVERAEPLWVVVGPDRLMDGVGDPLDGWERAQALRYCCRMHGEGRPLAEVVEAWRGILLVHRTLIRHFDQSLRDAYDLPLEQYDVLYQLSLAGGSRTMGDLAGALLVPASNCTRLVERMRGRGLVERRVDESDRRIIHASLTEAGHRLQRQAGRTHLRDIQEHFGTYVDAETAQNMVKAWAAIESDRWFDS